MPNSQGQTVFADAYTLPSWDELDAAGFDGAAFYLSHNKRKEPTAEWIAEGLRRNRILVPVGEDTGRGSLGGAPAGEAFARFMNGELARIGWPKDRLFANAESDYPAKASGPVLAYYKAFHDFSDNKNILVYADGEVGRAVTGNGWATFHWLTCSGGFPGSHDRTGVDVWQRCTGEPGNIYIPGHSLDTNIVVNPALFGHTPPPPVPQGELDMATVQDLMNQAERIHEDVITHIKAVEAKVDATRAGELIDIASDQADAKADGVKP